MTDWREMNEDNSPVYYRITRQYKHAYPYSEYSEDTVLSTV